MLISSKESANEKMFYLDSNISFKKIFYFYFILSPRASYDHINENKPIKKEILFYVNKHS